MSTYSGHIVNMIFVKIRGWVTVVGRQNRDSVKSHQGKVVKEMTIKPNYNSDVISSGEIHIHGGSAVPTSPVRTTAVLILLITEN
jgi:hypothetical protein